MHRGNRRKRGWNKMNVQSVVDDEDIGGQDGGGSVGDGRNWR